MKRMDTINAIETKRAVREFSERPVPQAVIEQVLRAGRMAQSSHNGQPWQFVCVRDRETLAKLAACGRWAGHLAGAAFAIALVADSERDAFDLGQAAAYLQLAAWELGLGSCLAAMWEPERAKQILGVPPERHFDLAISFGYPAAPLPPGPIRGRKPLGQVVRWERWQ
jgi:nitroreductase